MAGRAMQTAVSGIRNQQTYMDVIANNISNSGTMGYKKGRITFEESFYQLLQGASRPPGDQGGVNPLQIGNGTSVGSIDTLFTQGPIESTGNQSDIAIRGEGFFVVAEGNQYYYTRAGSFQWDSNGTMVIPFNGMKVQGRIANENGVVSDGSPIQDIVVPFGTVDPAKTTTEVNFVGNLDSAAEPLGNVLRTARMYSREVAGSTTDINGLYANGDADLQITGMSSLSTTITVTITDATTGDHSKTFTYVAEDTGPSSLDFNTLDNLVAEINSEFSTYVNAAVNNDGALRFNNLGAATNTITLSSVNSVLDKALGSANGIIGDKTTDQFSHVAVASDNLTTLRNYQGVNLGLTLANTITVDGRVGGTAINTSSINVNDGEGNSLTYGEYVKLIKDAFGITNTTAVEIDSTTGAMIINADGGLENEITAVNISTNSKTSGGTAQVFDSVFDATIGNWNQTQEAEDVTHSAAVQVFDSLGNTHTLTLEFKKDVTLPNRWEWSITVPEPAELSGGSSGSVSFDSNGFIESFSYSQGASSLTFDPKNGAEVPVDIVLDFGTIGSADGITQFASTSTAIARDQNGYSAGTLDNVVVGQNGTITGVFTNGNSRTLARLVLATFNNPAGLLRVGDNTFDVSSNSGLPIYGFADSSINATLTPGAVEMSNVDIAEEFTSMIMAQRSFQANARTVTTSDEILQETVNLKR
ncbi:MAG: flagellar hook-basal body complex protein [Candidatus Latescibacteria bacterium]|nr:flagellar hook-basal body complex protein [Candidatus Latescibacterota bacterium]